MKDELDLFRSLAVERGREFEVSQRELLRLCGRPETRYESRAMWRSIRQLIHWGAIEKIDDATVGVKGKRNQPARYRYLLPLTFNPNENDTRKTKG